METDQAELLKRISSFLQTNNIPYMITGAWSAIYYGRPRASHDIDFVVELYPKDVQKVLSALNQLSEDFLIQENSIKEAIAQKGMFNILHLQTMLKLDFWLLRDDSFDKSRFSRRTKVEILGQIMEMATAEDTILQKLKWYKEGKIEKHLIDAAFVYQIQQENLDKTYLDNWMKKLGLEKYYQELEEVNLENYL